MHEREALKLLFQPIFPDIERILPIEEEGQYIAFEWTPPKDLLREAAGSSKTLRRGMANTSIDFAFLYRTQQQQTVMVLGECKYTEPIPKTKISPEDAYKRLEPYLQLLTEENSPFIINVKDHLTLFGSDEYYQLFRQQLLAMLLAKEYQHKVDAVKLLHLYLSEGENNEGKNVSRESHYQLWSTTLKEGVNFSAVQMPYLESSCLIYRKPALEKWQFYLRLRYLIVDEDS